MKFSFVIPVYNAESYIGRCLDSILNQNIEDYEIICINDGSKDGSLEVLKDYERRFPGKFNIISQENQGIGPARNNAFKAVKGDYTWFIDNDDCIQGNCLKELAAAMDSTGADILNITHVKGFFTENPLYAAFSAKLDFTKIDQEHALYFYSDAPWSKIYRTDFLKKNNLFFPNIFGEDTSTTFDLYSKTTEIYKTDVPLYAWFERHESFSHAVISKKHFETFPVLLETLKNQSEKCDSRLKPYYENLMLRKADVYLPYFASSKIDKELLPVREECLRKSNEILSTLPSNILFDIYKSDFAEKEGAVEAAKAKLRSYYENSTSWKITKPLRAAMKIFRK